MPTGHRVDGRENGGVTDAELTAEVERLRADLDRITHEHVRRTNRLIAERDKAVAGKLGMPEGVYETLRWALDEMPLSQKHNAESRTFAMVWIGRARLP